MLIKPTPLEVYLKAHAVCNAVFQSLLNAQNDPEKEAFWFSHADKLEHKFTTEHGKHYSYFLTHPKEQP